MRCAYFCRRQLSTRARRLTALFLLLLFVCGLFYVLLLFFNWCFEIDTSVEIDIEKSAHYQLSPYDARAYEWLVTTPSTGKSNRIGNIAGVVAATVVSARDLLKHARQIVVVHSNHCDIANSTAIVCADAAAYPTPRMTQEQIFYKRMQLQAYRFLAHNHKQRPCVCGPLLGYKVRYLAIYAGTKTKLLASMLQNSGDKAPATATATESDTTPPTTDDAVPSQENMASFIKEIDVDRNTNAVVVHMFNPSDEHEDIYDALDAAQMKERNIGLEISLESQNYRYNETRGVFNVLRRTRIRAAYQDEECRWLRPWISGAAAICVQECFDLMRGIDVRERARMQYKNGVLLNDKYFGVDENVRPSCVAAGGGDVPSETPNAYLHHDL